MKMKKKVNIFPENGPVLNVTPPIYGVTYNHELSLGDIQNCIYSRAKVEEILDDGSKVILTLRNFNKDNETKKEEKKEEKKVETPKTPIPPKAPEVKTTSTIPPVTKADEQKTNKSTIPQVTKDMLNKKPVEQGATQIKK